MALSDQSFEQLPVSMKKRFPFRISVPSFIYPDHWLANIRLLAPYVDEIEVLIFDSVHKTDLPTEDDIRQMVVLADAFDLRYNVHLPIDISLGSPHVEYQQRAVDMVTQTVALTAPLNPTARVLHLPLDGPARDPMEITCWRQRLEKSVDAIIQNGIPGHTFSVENLNYPMEWIRPIIERFDMAICLDMGHLLDRGINWRPEYQKWKNRINMIHLHGVRDGQDHCALDALSPAVFTPILAALTSFKETVSIEVFSFKNLKKSLVYLEKYRQNSA